MFETRVTILLVVEEKTTRGRVSLLRYWRRVCEDPSGLLEAGAGGTRDRTRRR
jgi:hypothetical protein